MKFPRPVPVTEIAQKINAEIIGDDTLLATGINEIHKVEPGDITFSDIKKYFDKSLQSAASIIILNEPTNCPPGKAILVCENPFEAYDSLIREHRPFIPRTANVSETANIHPSVIIEPGVVIAGNVSIGANSYIQANTVIFEHTTIGENVIIEPNCTIGCDAFYFKRYPGKMQRWRSGGRTIIENDVHIGAGCTIARGVSGDTIIGAGSKLDCQIQIGHGVVIGKNCLFAAQVGIGGKTVVEDGVVLYGQVGIAQNLHIGTGAVVLAKSGVSKNLEGGKTYFGYPAQEMNISYRELAALRQLPTLLKKSK
jgi:UDP-3-O-[3-hydroxymyristoyl] glucosamine N-acyltransferase